MSATLNALLPYLDWLAGAGGGLLASWLFDRIRDSAAMPHSWWLFLHTARYARYITLALSIVFSIAAVALAAAIRGDLVLSAVDAALAGVITAQLRHAVQNLPNTPPEVEWTFEPEDDDNEPSGHSKG